MSRTSTQVVPHPNGGKISFYNLKNGVTVSVLDTGYQYADDYEIHQRSTTELEEGLPRVILGTELRARDLNAVWKVLDELEAAPA